MIDHLHSIWNIETKHIFDDVFTGYESVYEELDSHTVETYNADPAGTIDSVFDIYRAIGLTPITYFTEAGLTARVREVQKLSRLTRFNKTI